MKEIIEILKKEDGIKALLAKGKVFLVGGLVRDSFIGKESKDVDLLVTNIPLSDIAELLKPFGRVDEVGESFGVVKFTPSNWGMEEPIDIAIPRTETKIGEGHKGFEVVADPELPIETDLFRRDFTINAIACDLDGNIIDPFNGIGDLNSGIIRMVNPDAFADDPLRMLRCIQFSSRFGFKIDQTTWDSILENQMKIRTISGERILEEMDKIFFKGDIKLGLQLLESSGLRKCIFKHVNKDKKDDALDLMINNIKTREDFYAVICSSNHEVFKTTLKGDAMTAKGIKAIKFAFDNFAALGPNMMSEPHHRMIAFESIKVSESIIESMMIPGMVRRAMLTLDGATFPRTRKDLAINGEDVKALNLFKEKDIGKVIQLALQTVMFEDAPNDKDILLEIIKRNKLKVLS